LFNPLPIGGIMAFSSKITVQNVDGNKRIMIGTYTNTAGSTGGDINTGMHKCDLLYLQPMGSAVGTNYPVVNEVFPVAGNAVTIVTDADQDGYWFAIGT
jgi:hypothetical protein